MDGLWTKDQRTATAAAAAAQQAARLDRIRKGMVPGTWLSLAPAMSPKHEAIDKWLPLSPKSSPLSPSIKSPATPLDDELSLDDGRFLSNDHTSSRRASSVSSARSGSGPVSTKPHNFSVVSTIDERETLGLARFLSN
jgi:hypothetical protein